MDDRYGERYAMLPTLPFVRPVVGEKGGHLVILEDNLIGESGIMFCKMNHLSFGDFVGEIVLPNRIWRDTKIAYRIGIRKCHFVFTER